MKKNSAITIAKGIAIAALITFASAHASESRAPGIASGAGNVYALFLWVCAAIALLVFASIIYCHFAFHHANSAHPKVFDRKRVQELVWALVPIVIVIAAAAPTLKNAAIGSIDADHAVHSAVARVEYPEPTSQHERKLDPPVKLSHR